MIIANTKYISLVCQSLIHQTGIVGAILFVFMATACSSPNEEQGLTENIKNVWEEMQTPIEEYASDYCLTLESEPERLQKDCKADWNSFIDCLEITIPIDWGTRTATSLLFGEFFSNIDDLNRMLKDKPSVKKQIVNNLDNDWLMLMICLVAREGSLDYVIETDAIVDNTIEFSDKELYNILIDNGYLAAGCGDSLPSDGSNE